MGDMTNMPTTGTVPVFDKADRLGKALDSSGVSVQDMADELGVSRNTVGNYLNRRTQISKSATMVWALRTGVSYEWLETGRAPDGDGDGGGADQGTMKGNMVRYSNRMISLAEGYRAFEGAAA